MDFSQTLHRASWRGVPFGLELGSAKVGRRQVQHEYPNRDTVWMEDQGRAARTFSLTGFLVGNSAVYGGGDVQNQRRRMESAAETKGPGILVHPSRGRLTVDLLDLVITEHWDEGNYFELQFNFVQGSPRVYPAAKPGLGAAVGKASSLLTKAGLSTFVSAVAGPLTQGLDAATSIANSAQNWIGQVSTLAHDATSLYGTVSQLAGGNYGRYFNGRNSGFLSGLSSIYSQATTITDLIGIGAGQRDAVSTAGLNVGSVISKLGFSTGAEDVANAIADHVSALRTSAADPADGVRILSALTRFTISAPGDIMPAAIATSDLYRRSAIAALAQTSSSYAPSSADDANRVRDVVLGPIDAEIAHAGDTGADDVFSALRGLRQSVVQDLGERGGALARLGEFSFPSPLPSIVIAQQKYGDAGRNDELITQADPSHPWFMPATLKALVS